MLVWEGRVIQQSRNQADGKATGKREAGLWKTCWGTLRTEPRRELQLLGVPWEVRLERQMEHRPMAQPPVNRATAYFCGADQVVTDSECLAHSRSAVNVILKIIYPKKISGWLSILFFFQRL